MTQPLCKDCKPSNDNAYGLAEGTIDRYSRYAQEMQQIRKEECEN